MHMFYIWIGNQHSSLNGYSSMFKMSRCLHSVLRIKLNKSGWFFWVDFDHFWTECCFFEAAEAVTKIGLSVKINNHEQIWLIRIREMLCNITKSNHVKFWPHRLPLRGHPFFKWPGVNFTNILRAAFTLIDPKRVKKIDNLTVFFTLLRSARVKAVCRTLMKLSSIEQPDFLIS